MQTDPLSLARYPESTDSPDVPGYIQKAVNDLSDHVGGNFTTTAARDAAFVNWVAQGNTMANGLQCRVAGYPQVYRSGAWRGVTNQVFTAASVDTTVYTASHTVMTLSVPDPQCPYKLEVYGAVQLTQVGIGVYVRGQQRVNGAAINPWGIQFQNNTGATITGGVIVSSGGPGVSATLTGASTVDFFINKEAGPAGNGFQAGGGGADPFWILSAKVLPV